MIYGILMGKKVSGGFPGKNLFPVLGKPLMTYPLEAGLNSNFIDDVFVTTDDDAIKKIANEFEAKIIDRPPELCTLEAPGEDVFVHAYDWIRTNVSADIELIVLLLCNCATVTSEIIDQGIEVLRNDASIDSAVSVSAYNMWSPVRARKIDEKGLLKPFVPFENYDKSVKITCDRDSQGDVFFADMGVSVIRPECLDKLDEGMLPQKWMGRNIHPLKQWGGFDVDYEWQIPAVEYWLKKHNVVSTQSAGKK